MKDWRELFEDDALVDGWELYLDGKVENLEVYEERKIRGAFRGGL